jgi:hypothetical protein
VVFPSLDTPLWIQREIGNDQRPSLLHLFSVQCNWSVDFILGAFF